MKFFLRDVLKFSIPIFLFVILLEVLIRSVPNMYSYKNNFLNTNCNLIETLILGDSHTMYGVNPNFIEGYTFNASHVSQSLDIDYEILKKHEKCFNNLNKLIIRLSYTTLFEKLSATNEAWRLKDYVLYYQMPLSKKIKYKFEFLSVKLNNNLTRLFNYYLKDGLECNWDKFGWGTDATRANSVNPSLLGLKTAKKHTIKNHQYKKEFISVFESILQFCKSRGIEVYVVTLPSHSSYVENLESKQLNQTINFGTLIAETNSNCSYFNFLTDKRFVDSDFFDADHLNEDGAEKLSKIINQLIFKTTTNDSL